MLNNFLKEHAYRLSQISSRGSNITIHPEEHHGCECFGRMVLHSAPWCFNLALGLIWRYHVKSKYMSIQRVTCVVLIGCGLSLKGVTAVDQEGPPGEGVLKLSFSVKV